MVFQESGLLKFWYLTPNKQVWYFYLSFLWYIIYTTNTYGIDIKVDINIIVIMRSIDILVLNIIYVGWTKDSLDNWWRWTMMGVSSAKTHRGVPCKNTQGSALQKHNRGVPYEYTIGEFPTNTQ